MHIIKIYKELEIKEREIKTLKKELEQYKKSDEMIKSLFESRGINNPSELIELIDYINW